MTTSVPTPPKLRKAKAAAVTAAAMAATAALTIGGTTAASTAVLADRDQTIAASLTEDVSLSASIGIYPVGPGAQIARMLGAGTPEGALRTLGAMAALIPGEQGEAFRATLNTLAAALETAQDGIQVLPAGLLPDITVPQSILDLLALIGVDVNIPDLPLGTGIKIAFPEIAVPALGPAGTYDAVAGLEGDLSTQLLLTVLKTVMTNTDLLDLVPGGVLPDDLAALVDLLQGVPLNVPGEEGGINVTLPGIPGLIPGTWIIPPIELLDLNLFFSTADRIAIIPTFGLGGTNAAITAPSFLNESQFAKTVVLIIPIRNTSRPGGGMLAMLTPLSSLVGINMSNVDGREGNGNVTFWDITAAYDIMSDAPSTVFSPAAWANSVTGAFMPTYLIPQNVEQFAGVIEDIVSGDIGLDTVLQLLAAGNITDLFHIDTDAADGNMYITYDSGNLPLLEPFQFLPRTISYLPGFDISTPGSESFNDFLTQLVAMGYQDVNLTGAGVGEIPTFVRGFDEAGTQAKFWTNPVSFEAGLQAPQALFNALIGDGVSTGLTGNLFNPEAQDLTLFGSSAIGDAVYRNALTVAVAGFVREALLELKTQLNPLFDAVDSNEALVAFAKQLDEATKEADNLLASAGDSIRDLGVDLSGPLMDGNRAFNNLVGGNPAGAAGDLGGLSGLAVAEDQNEGSSTATRAAAPADEVADVEAQPIPEGSVVTDLFTNTEGLDRAVKVADALNPRKALQAAAADANERVEKRVTKTQNSLRKANERAALVGEKLRDGDVAGAAKQVGANVQNRVERLKKDVNNGVNKLRGGDTKSKKTATAAKPDNDSKDKSKDNAA